MVAYAALDLAAAGQDAAGQDAPELTEQIVVIGQRNTTPGSSAAIDKIELDRFDHVDITRVLSMVPGIYVREEDGYGLRPNIGIRGAAAERSQKITILQDGVPVAPAVYSAPAAYYTPNVGRAHAVEVLKGPSAIHHGPHTVGGAVNLVTRPVPPDRLVELDLTLGADAYHKLVALYGAGDDRGGLLLEALRYGTDGFKELDGGGDTGFIRNDLGAKFLWTPTSTQRLVLRIGYADEDADETYLGLTDDDFAVSPERRYLASRLDRFQSGYVGGHVNYDFALGSAKLNAKSYWHRFDRVWNKLDGFLAGRTLPVVLSAPQRFAREHGLLTGGVDSVETAAQTLDVTDSDRGYDARGVQVSGVVAGDIGQIRHRLRAGLRLHRDAVRREHTPRGYLVRSGELVWDGVTRRPKLRNRADTTALALFASQELSWREATLTVGVRYETIDGRRDDLRTGTTFESTQEVLAPGLGLHWPLSPSLSLLAGVHRGFSPAGPGAGVEPERSLNYEYGLRYHAGAFGVEAVGFSSDYENLLGRCRISDSGCQAGDEFNAGEVEIGGVELAADFTRSLGTGLNLEAKLAYTYTTSAFRDSFLSGFSQWGLVQEGDELPYLPSHRGHLRVGLTGAAWDVFADISRRSPMREEPGVDAVEEGLHADGLTTLDLSVTWRIREATRLQLLANNVTDEAAIVAHRPLGARPNRPRWFALRVRQSF